jgi:hypothetical protein
LRIGFRSKSGDKTSWSKLLAGASMPEQSPHEARIEKLAEQFLRRLGAGPRRQLERRLEISAQVGVDLGEHHVEMLRRALRGAVAKPAG